VKRLLDWRSALVYTHRWLGIAGCVLFIAWFLSGIVLMYARMPSLSAEERLARLSPLDLSRAAVEPADAEARVPFPPSTLRVSMLGERPVYRFSAGPYWATVYADTGETLSELSAEEAIQVARTFAPDHTGTLRHQELLTEPDQWTLSAAMRPLMPLHRVGMGDSAGTTLYVSALTGEPVLKTTQSERFWGYLGAVIHWLYFTPLRKNTGLWVDVVVWVSLAGCVMCLSGLVWGLWRFSPFRRYRLKRVPARSPYAGFMKWHHYAGLFFGFTTCTWIFSGLMSMTPWDWSPGNSPTRQQREAATGGPFLVQEITLDRLRQSAAALSAAFAPREVEVMQFRGEPFVVAYRPPSETRALAWLNTDFAAFVEPVTLERQQVWLAAPQRGLFTRFPDEAIKAIAEQAMPEAAMTEAIWLHEYDSYYYDRSRTRALPVLRARYNDEVETWLYLDPFRGAVVQKEERRTRLERWLYHGLHSLDFPFLYDKRPLWDIIVLALMIGGTVLSVTTLVPAWRRLRRRARRMAGSVRARVPPRSEVVADVTLEADSEVL